MKIDSSMSEEQRRRYKVVRLDSLSDLDGLIVVADEQEGTATLKDKSGEDKAYSFGPRGIVILLR